MRDRIVVFIGVVLGTIAINSFFQAIHDTVPLRNYSSGHTPILSQLLLAGGIAFLALAAAVRWAGTALSALGWVLIVIAGVIVVEITTPAVRDGLCQGLGGMYCVESVIIRSDELPKANAPPSPQ